MRPVAETAFTNIAKKDLGVRQFVWHPIDAMAAWRIYPLFPLVECGVEKRTRRADIQPRRSVNRL